MQDQPRQGKREGAAVRKDRSAHNDEQTWRAELVIVAEHIRLDDPALIEQPTREAAWTIQTVPLPGWDGCGPLCPKRQNGDNSLA